MNYLSDNSSRPTHIALTKDGIPRCLGPWIERVRLSKSPSAPNDMGPPVGVKVLAFLTTVLFSSRSFKTGRTPDISTIITPVTEEKYEETLLQASDRGIMKSF